MFSLNPKMVWAVGLVLHQHLIARCYEEALMTGLRLGEEDGPPSFTGAAEKLVVSE